LGVKGVFFGAPYNYANRVYTASGTGAELEDDAVLAEFARVAADLQRRHLAPMWCLHRFAASPANTRLFERWGVTPADSWPDTVVDFARLRSAHRERRELLQARLDALAAQGFPPKKKREKRETEEELARLGQQRLTLDSYPEHIESSNDRHNFRKNRRRFQDNPGFRLVEVPADRAQALLPQIMDTSRAMYAHSLTQWLPVPEGLFRALMQLPSTRTWIAWHEQAGDPAPTFAGFVVKLARGRTHVNFRMGISPKFSHWGAANAGHPQSLVWHRLMVHEIGDAMEQDADRLYCGPTCYVAKKRLGYLESPIVSGFALKFVAARRLRPMLLEADTQMRSTLDQY
jgi:hypothetical protein